MAEEIKTPEIEKTPEQNATTAPVVDKPVDENPESIDAEDFDDALMLLNIMDKEVGGKGEISGIPEDMRNSIKYLVEKLIFVRDLFEDPLWKAILDDMADQKEDGNTPSIEVAIARNIPLDKIQAITESEDYEGVQNELSSNLTAKKQAEEEEAQYEASFEESKKAGEEYAAKMGYDEDEKNALFQHVLDMLKITADGKLTVKEFELADKMRNYDKDTEELRSQIQEKEAKEVLPDKASIETAVAANKKEKPKSRINTPGIGSMSVYDNAVTDITKIGSRNRGKK